MAANNVLLTWNANTEPDLAGYRVFFTLDQAFFTTGGSASSVDVGLTTSFSFAVTEFFHPLTADGRYYFAVSAYDTSGNLSPFSSVVSKRIIRFPSRLRRRK